MRLYELENHNRQKERIMQDKFSLNKIASTEGPLDFREIMVDDIFDPENALIIENNALLIHE